MQAKLTELSVARIKPPRSGRLEVWDSTLPAFGLRVTATGAKSYVVAMRKPGAKHPSRVKVGEPGEPPRGMSLADARTKARKMMADPGALETPPEGEDDTFGDLAAAFLGHARTKRGRVLRPATVKEYRRALLTYAAGLHGRPVSEIRRAQAADLIRTVATQAGATSAMRARAAGSRFYSWLIANGKVEHNPFTGTEGYDVPKRERVLSDGELAAIWFATAGHHDFNLILRIMLWTGCRRSEAGGMRWSELVDGVWLIPGSRTKNHRSLALPLPRQALAALNAWHRFVGRDLVFGRGPAGFQAWSQSKRRLDARLAFNQSWDLHDARRTVETRMAGLGIPREHVNKVLNHATGPITETYDRWSYLPEKSRALQSWADELEGIDERGEAKVIALR
jgi:integrase